MIFICQVKYTIYYYIVIQYKIKYIVSSWKSKLKNAWEKDSYEMKAYGKMY